MFWILRTGLRASGSRGAQQPPPLYPPGLGTLIFLTLFIGVLVETGWWLPVVCVLGSLMFILTIMAIAKAPVKQSGKPDPLDKALADLLAPYDENGRRK